jgi:redox-sensitive bicupin YhaK (pirin superfamily)
VEVKKELVYYGKRGGTFSMNLLGVSRFQKPKIDIRRKSDQFRTRIDWLNSYHSFSFGPHYDPENTHHGLLLVSNDDIIHPNSGFMTHPHRDMEIVTWVLDGELEHKDSVGNKGLIYPGLAQRMSAGSGIYHSEINQRGDKAVHLIQMWVIPDSERITPSYQQMDINRQLDKGGLIPIASGRGHDAAITIQQKGAVLWGGRLKPGETVQIPDSPFVHLYLARGKAVLESAGPLDEGDAVRLTGGGPMRITGDPGTGAEVLIWEMSSAL